VLDSDVKQRRSIPGGRALPSVALLVGLWSTAAAASSPVSSDPVFKALLIDGRTISGRIVSLGDDAITLAAAEGARHELSLKNLVKLTRDVPLPIAAADRAHVLLPDGDRIMQVFVGPSTETTLEVQSLALGKLTVPLDCLVGLILAAPSSPNAFESLWDRVRVEPRTTEVIWLLNGDRLTGSFLGLDDQQVKIQVDGKPVELEKSGVVAILFDPGLVNYPRPKKDFTEVTLADGTRLGVTGARLNDGNVLATTRFGQSIRFPVSELVRFGARTASVVYLSERKPAGVQYVSYVGPAREMRVDRTVDGHLFQLAGQTYDRGIGTQSRTLLAYRLEPNDRRFQALVGVDERAGPLGSVVFRVIVDGDQRLQTPPMTDRDPPKAIDVDVSGARHLILITEFGERGDVRDLADWVEARLIR
jgi:hypothetical protein